ncbi:hypothetical protein QUA54_25420 [Microcoleus sp. MOSTC5]
MKIVGGEYPEYIAEAWLGRSVHLGATARNLDRQLMHVTGPLSRRGEK